LEKRFGERCDFLLKHGHRASSAELQPLEKAFKESIITDDALHKQLRQLFSWLTEYEKKHPDCFLSVPVRDSLTFVCETQKRKSTFIMEHLDSLKPSLLGTLRKYPKKLERSPEFYAALALHITELTELAVDRLANQLLREFFRTAS